MIGSDNDGMAPNRQQAINWANDGQIHGLKHV